MRIAVADQDLLRQRAVFALIRGQAVRIGEYPALREDLLRGIRRDDDEERRYVRFAHGIVIEAVIRAETRPGRGPVVARGQRRFADHPLALFEQEFNVQAVRQCDVLIRPLLFNGRDVRAGLLRLILRQEVELDLAVGFGCAALEIVNLQLVVARREVHLAYVLVAGLAQVLNDDLARSEVDAAVQRAVNAADIHDQLFVDEHDKVIISAEFEDHVLRGLLVVVIGRQELVRAVLTAVVRQPEIDLRIDAEEVVDRTVLLNQRRRVKGGIVVHREQAGDVLRAVARAQGQHVRPLVDIEAILARLIHSAVLAAVIAVGEGL